MSGLQWVVDAYTLTFAALILAAGALGDRRGAKRVLLGGFALFTLASVACGLVPALGGLIAARAVQGIGAAALGACSLVAGMGATAGLRTACAIAVGLVLVVAALIFTVG